MLILIIVAVVIAVAAVLIGLAQNRSKQSLPSETLGRKATRKMGGGGDTSPWLVTFILLACEAAGVTASFYITQVALKPGQNVILLSLIVAAANFAGSLTGRKLSTPLTPLDIFTFFKDGLLWPAALPALARALGVNPTP
jgi:hypothetical protein